MGNITVKDYDVGSRTVTDPNSNNMIGLVSGGYIAFNKTWTKHFNTDGADATKYVSEQVTSSTPGVAPGLTGHVGKLHITAAIMAVCQFNDNLWDGTTWRNYQMSGTEWWDGMWGTPVTSPNGRPFADPANKGEDYGFQLYGNHILAAYSRTIYGIPERGCQDSVTFSHDPRMYEKNLQPPGFPGVKNGTTLLTLRLRDWKEENKL